ncbi:hypothetical protein SJ05684_b60150 (plasmid) [Sinorhizobium sojae CCBAU 05684]|uniref:Uncharacterized protein n=1 Tax=Sinorhizobium sojae CCBAU 05684 TaxID=716928 RepID=A0A249PML7_9HYPH|nr:hypothetical protein [Sinorhizobium sojae]ASY66997.1 hypothetical protein SJ05684_b60150 [Sinorhizobium sojae CCBAU 05684]
MAGYSVHRFRGLERQEETGPGPDFRVTYSRSSGWQIEIVSRHAHEWAKANASPALFNNEGGRISTDLAGVNHLVYNARTDGLKTEYIGPRRILTF